MSARISICLCTWAWRQVLIRWKMVPHFRKKYPELVSKNQCNVAISKLFGEYRKGERTSLRNHIRGKRWSDVIVLFIFEVALLYLCRPMSLSFHWPSVELPWKSPWLAFLKWAHWVRRLGSWRSYLFFIPSGAAIFRLCVQFSNKVCV